MTFRGRTLSSGAYPRSRENRNTLNNKTGKVKSKLHNLSTINEKLNFYMKYIYHLVDCILTPLHYDNKNFFNYIIQQSLDIFRMDTTKQKNNKSQ